MTKKVTVLIPCRNEKKYIPVVLDNAISQDYPKEFIEIIIIDGKSDDGSIEIINQYVTRYSFIKLITNPQKVVPFALNYGIKAATGDIIIRMDAHSQYPNDYFSQLVHYLDCLNADNVGGVWITNPSNKSLQALAIAKASSSIFGVGNAQYRLHNDSIKEVDTVPFGCFRREIFDKIGMFDEDLVRNQDDEFNARLKKYGGKIFLIPEIKIKYFARESFSKLSKMFYQYGLFKPLVNRKIGKPATLRQFFPLLFVFYLIVLGLVALFSIQDFLLFSTLLGIYLMLDLVFSINIAIIEKNISLLLYLLITFLIIHLSYGWGYLVGIYKYLIFHKKINYQKFTVTR